MFGLILGFVLGKLSASLDKLAEDVAKKDDAKPSWGVGLGVRSRSARAAESIAKAGQGHRK